ncbi:hypothetical protein [Agromyces sp. SYSU T00194]|uniref:hypothetical protein n=1 Tax=Agromyces chitinivorans TaxID=3158560 RepID=UPI00339596D2
MAESTTEDTTTTDASGGRPGAGRVIATLLLLVLFLLVTAGLSVLGLFLPSFTEDCVTEAACDRQLIGWASLLAIFGPWLVALVVVIWTAVRMLRRRGARWLPLVGIVVNAGVFGLGLWLASGGVG